MILAIFTANTTVSLNCKQSISGGICFKRHTLFYFAEDIVQETFLKLWQGRSYQETGKELMYLYVIAR